MKQLNINPPKGYEIDLDKSDLSEGIIHFKECKKTITYVDVAIELFKNKASYYITSPGNIVDIPETNSSYLNPNKSTSREQLESILALNKLCNVAKDLNEDWLPSFKNDEMHFHLILSSNRVVSILSSLGGNAYSGSVYFKTKKLAQQAIDILGVDTIRKALTLNH